MLTPGSSVTPAISAKCNPWLAGQPAGVSASLNNPANSPDWSAGTAGKTDCSPAQVGLTMSGGQSMTFDGAAGSATYDPGVAAVSADGNTGQCVTNTAGGEHGLSNVVAPINAIMAVFVSDTAPGSSASPATLNFSTAASRDFTTLSPALNQVFFVGDGRTSAGAVQQFIVPPGGTRLFMGDMDAYQWNNNVGQFTLTAHTAGHVTTAH